MYCMSLNTHNADTKDEFYAKRFVSCTFANEPLASEKKNAGDVLTSRGTTSCLQIPIFRGTLCQRYPGLG